MQTHAAAQQGSGDLELTHQLCEKAKAFIPAMGGLVDPLSARVVESKHKEAGQKLREAMDAFLQMDREKFDQKVVEEVENAWVAHEQFVTDSERFWKESALQEHTAECLLEAERCLIEYLHNEEHPEVAKLMRIVESMQVGVFQSWGQRTPSITHSDVLPDPRSH